LEVCSISLLPIGNWPQVAPLTGQSPCIVGIGLWHTLWGGTATLFILIVCLLACLICLPALITIACDRTVDRPVPSFIITQHVSGVAVVGTTRSPSDALQQKVFLSRQNGDRTRCIAWVWSVSIHWSLQQRYEYHNAHGFHSSGPHDNPRPPFRPSPSSCMISWPRPLPMSPPSV